MGKLLEREEKVEVYVNVLMLVLVGIVIVFEVCIGIRKCCGGRSIGL